MEKPEQNWGKLLKYFRQKKKLNQDDVAFGICTPSYLSRIENELVIADDTMYEQLFNNLGINFSHLQQDLEIQTNLLETIYAKLLANILLDTEEIKQLQVFQQNEQSFELQIIDGNE